MFLSRGPNAAAMERDIAGAALTTPEMAVHVRFIVAAARESSVLVRVVRLRDGAARIARGDGIVTVLVDIGPTSHGIGAAQPAR